MQTSNFPHFKITFYFTNHLLSKEESILKRTTRDLRRWRHLLSGEQISRLDLSGGGRNGPRTTVTLFSGHFRFSGPLNMHAEKVEGWRDGADDVLPAYFGAARELLFGPKSGAVIALLPPPGVASKKG